MGLFGKPKLRDEFHIQLIASTVFSMYNKIGRAHCEMLHQILNPSDTKSIELGIFTMAYGMICLFTVLDQQPTVFDESQKEEFIEYMGAYCMSIHEESLSENDLSFFSNCLKMINGLPQKELSRQGTECIRLKIGLQPGQDKDVREVLLHLNQEILKHTPLAIKQNL